MEKEKAKFRIAELVDLIIMHDKLYEENRPIITDSEYDALYLELVEIEDRYPDLAPAHSPTKNIYTKTVDSLAKVSHSVPMLSQDKATTIEKIETWREQSASSNVIIQHKMDGLTLVLTYEEGQLKKAVTRGNGIVGEDVTHNAMVIGNIPKLIAYKALLEVRGEVVIPFSEFERINTDGQYSNPRNLASGTIRQLDAQKSSRIKLQFYAFDIANKYAIGTLTTETDVNALLNQLGFTTVKSWFVRKNDHYGIAKVLDSIQTERPNLPFMIDGAVVKFDDFKTQEELGSTSKFPKWAIAFKFQSLDATTTLYSVTWQVGKSGQITPVATFAPVNIDGVEISRATLHNYSNIKNKDIRIYDTIIVSRANDVIPHIEQSIKSQRDGSELIIEKPTSCPVCGSPISETNRSGDSPIMRCLNPLCKPQVIGKMVHWTSRDAMNIMGVGEQTITDLNREGILNSILDIYTNIQNNKQKIAYEMEGYGETKFENMVESIKSSLKANLSCVLYGLSINQVGLSTAKDIAKAFGTMSYILECFEQNPQLIEQKLRGIDGIADSVTEEFVSFFTDANVTMIKQLMSIGMTMTEPQTVVSDKLNGKTFVITGVLTKPRSEIQKLIESLGGKVSGSVSAKTTFLLLGDGEENSTKHKKAIELNIAIINEDQFNALID